MAKFASTVQFQVNAETKNIAVLDDFRKRVDGIGQAAGQSTRGIGSLSTGLTSLSASLAPLAALLSVASLVSFGRQTLEMAGRLDDASKSTRVAAETLDRYQQVAELAGVSFEQVTGGLAKFNKSIADAASGNQAAADAFGQLGISVKNQDGTLRSTEEVFADFAKRVREAPNDAAIFEQGTILLGRSFANLIPFFQEGTYWIDQFKSRFSKGSIQELAEFDDQILRIQKGFGNMGITIVENVVPPIQSLFTIFAETREGIQNFINTNETLEAVLDGISAAFINAKAEVKTFKAAIESFGDNASFSQELSRIQKEQQVALKRLSETRTLGNVNLNIAGDLPTKGSQSSKPSGFSPVPNGGIEERFKALDEERKKNAKSEEAAAKESEKRQQGIARLGEERARMEKQMAEDRAREAERQKNTLSDFSNDNQSRLDDLQLEIDLVGKSYKEQEKILYLRQIDNEVRQRGLGLSDENRAALEAEAEVAKKSIADALDELEAKRNSFSTGLQQGLNDYLMDIESRASAARELVGNALRGIEDAFVDLATTGKLSFKDLANSIIADISRIVVRQTVQRDITGPLASGLSGLFGGGFSEAAKNSDSTGGLFANLGNLGLGKFAAGGSFNVGGTGGIDSQLVAFRASPDEVVSVRPRGQSSGNSPVVINMNINTPDAGSFKASQGQINAALRKAVLAGSRNT